MALPDLTIYGPSTEPKIIFRTYSSNDCEVIEGCAVPGLRRLLNFTTEIRNLGPDDLSMGRPESNTNFVWAPCHGHYHFEDFALYRLLDASGTAVVTGRKMAFCLEDTARWNPTVNPDRRYSCSTSQGIQVGWADIYDAAVPCQWLDITGVPGGAYTLEMILDPNNALVEADEDNNIVRVAVTLPTDCQIPPNDAFANALVLTGPFATVRGDNVCATKQAGEPNHAGDPGGRSLWYRWTAPQSGSVVINTVGSDFDTLLAVYTGTAVSNLTLVAQNDDIVPGTNPRSQVTFNAVANTTYRIAVDGYGGAMGGVALNVNPPPNDLFASCQTLTGVTGQVSGQNMGGTKEAGEPAHAGNLGGRSVWYCWTAPASGRWTFDTSDSTFDTLLAVYTGNSVSTLTAIASDDNSGGNDQSLLSFHAVAGTNYRIAVDGFSGATGTIQLRWTTSPRLAINRIPGGLDIMLNGITGTYLLQASSNLVNWTTIRTWNNTTTTNRFFETQTHLKSRFYRAVRPAQ